MWFQLLLPSPRGSSLCSLVSSLASVGTVGGPVCWTARVEAGPGGARPSVSSADATGLPAAALKCGALSSVLSVPVWGQGLVTEPSRDGPDILPERPV